MKNVTTAGSSNRHNSGKAMIYRLFRHQAPVVLAGAVLSSLLLSGCLWNLPGKVVLVTTESPAIQTTAATVLPYGVKLQIDPSVLEPCKLERVVDGDTIIVHDPGDKRLRVRLTGINAPESVAEDESRNTEEGRLSSRFLKELLKDTETVYLEYDVDRTDQYNRTLAYVWIKYEDTYVMANEIILATGHAKPVYIKPNLKYADDFRKYE
ncbi:MAG: thermonuclease family protein [Clostridiales bacterium]|nr:thermonuclease family protein [Clostridiales bacterium]